MRKNTTALAQIPLVKSYLERLSYIILKPVKRLESTVFLWPAGNARTFFLKAVLEKMATVDRFTLKFFDFGSLDCQDFTDFRKQMPSKKELLEIIKNRRLLLVVDRADTLSKEDQENVFGLIEKVVSLDKTHIIASIHAGYGPNQKEFLTQCGRIPGMCLQKEIPLPNQKEMERIVYETGINSGLKINRQKAAQIACLSGPHIVLARAIIRALLINPALTVHLQTALLTPSYQLKYLALLPGLPEKMQTALSQKLRPPDQSTEKIALPFLTLREQKIYQELVSKQETGRDFLAQIIWGDKSFDLYSDWAIDKIMSRLRKKLYQNGYPAEKIKTVKGRGYKYDENA